MSINHRQATHLKNVKKFFIKMSSTNYIIFIKRDEVDLNKMVVS